MKTITKINTILFAIIVVMIFAFSASGQMFMNPLSRNEFKSEKHFFKNIQGFSVSDYKPGLNQPVYKSTQGSFPQEIHHFYWDVTTIWMPDENYYVTYDNFANILTELTVNANTSDTTTGIVNTYDAQGRLMESIEQIWNNGAWENDHKYYSEYDDQDNLTISMEFDWQGASWAPVGGMKYNYTYNINNQISETILQWWNTNVSSWDNWYKWINTYDVNGYLIEVVFQGWDINTSSWLSSSKYTYSINATGVVFEYLRQTWDNLSSSWVNSEKRINIVWYNWTGDPEDSEYTSFTVLHWTGGIWENYYRENYTYDNNGGWVRTAENYFNGNWVNSIKETDSFDDHGNHVLWQYEMWINNTWTIDMGNQNLMTYNGDDLTQCIGQMYDHVEMEYKNQWKEEYSDFVYIQGIDLMPVVSSEINLYPNPNNGIFNLEINNNNKLSSLEIVNLNGQVVYRRSLSDSGTDVCQIDLSKCSKGVYFLKVGNDTEIKVEKLVIQ